MRKKKEKTITLIANGKKRDFELKHAERLLDMGAELNGGWEVDPESEYYYDEENGIRLKTDKGNIGKA